MAKPDTKAPGATNLTLLPAREYTFASSIKIKKPHQMIGKHTMNLRNFLALTVVLLCSLAVPT